MAYLLGFFGITLGLMLIGLHLASLKSFGLPYLMPIAAGDTTKQKNYRDLFLRLPLKQ
jgi:spore germination protein KA